MVVAMRDSADRVQLVVLDSDTTGTNLSRSGYCEGSGQWGGTVTDGVGPVNGSNSGAMRGVVDLATGDLDGDGLGQVVNFLYDGNNNLQVVTLDYAAGQLTTRESWTQSAGSDDQRWWPTDVSAGDVDRDGKDEIVATAIELKANAYLEWGGLIMVWKSQIQAAETILLRDNPGKTGTDDGADALSDGSRSGGGRGSLADPHAP